RLTQQLVMTPQLQQAIRLLQLSRLELQDEIRKELDDNPILVEEEGGDSRGSREAETAAQSQGEGQPEPRFDADFRSATTEERQAEKNTREVDWEKFLENRSQQAPAAGPRGGFEELPPLEQNLTKPGSLKDHMLWQLGLGDFTDVERRFGELVIG